MMLAATAFGLAWAGSLGIERFGTERNAPRIVPSSLAPRLLMVSSLFAVWLGLFRRPLLAAFATLVTIAVLTAISVRKRQLVGEPLVFSDFGLLRTIVRHPDLYYLGFMRDPRFGGGVLAIAVGAGAWIWLEPPLLAPVPGLAITVASLAGMATVWRLAGWTPVAARLARWIPEPALEAHVGGWGLLLTLAAYALRWRGEIARPVHREAFTEEMSDEGGPPTVVIVVQLESFTDPVRSGLGTDPLPGLRRAQALARFYGPLAVPTHGAFTMRSEHEVLTGLSGRSGFRGFDPYLSRAGHVPTTLASDLKALGYRTVFMHPFRAGFFNRDVVLPRLGFDEFLWEQNFAAAARYGPYVSDPALADRVLAELRSSPGRPTFIMAVTMENHGPWSEGRLPDEPDPTRQYLRHLANADQAISRLIEGLSRQDEPCLLCLYGDHPPILPGRSPAPVPETEYAVLEFGPLASTRAPRQVSLSTDALGRLVRALALGRTPPNSAETGEERAQPCPT